MWLLASCNQLLLMIICLYHMPVLGHDIWKIGKIIFNWQDGLHNANIMLKIRKWMTFVRLIYDDEICFECVAV